MLIIHIPDGNSSLMKHRTGPHRIDRTCLINVGFIIFTE